MLRALANEPMPWKDVQVVQVDERVAPAEDADRNLTHLRDSLMQMRRCPQNKSMPCRLKSST